MLGFFRSTRCRQTLPYTIVILFGLLFATYCAVYNHTSATQLYGQTADGGPSWIFSSFWTAIFSALTALIFLGQLFAMRRTNDHFRVSERAYVKLSHDDPGIRWEGDTGKFKIALKITNHGNTPARVTDVVTNFFLPPKEMRITELPPYSRHNFPKETKAFLVKQDTFYQHIELSVEPDEQTALNQGTTVKLIFYGYADYIDQFGVHYRAGYGRQYFPAATANNLIFPAEGPFNYDRIREYGEGIDWD